MTINNKTAPNMNVSLRIPKILHINNSLRTRSVMFGSDQDPIANSIGKSEHGLSKLNESCMNV